MDALLSCPCFRLTLFSAGAPMLCRESTDPAHNLYDTHRLHGRYTYSFVATSFSSIAINSGAQTSEIMGSGTMTQSGSITYPCSFVFQAPGSFSLYNNGAPVAWTVQFNCPNYWSGTKVPTSTPPGAGIKISTGTTATCGFAQPPPPNQPRVGAIPPPPAKPGPPPPKVAPPPPSTCLLISTVPTTGSASRCGISHV